MISILKRIFCDLEMNCFYLLKVVFKTNFLMSVKSTEEMDDEIRSEVSVDSNASKGESDDQPI